MPKLPVPKFLGHFAQWHNFYTQFTTLIDANEQLTSVQKFLYLQTALSDGVAITLVKQRYDNPRRLVTHHCAALSEFPTIRAHSLKHIQSFIDTFNVHFQALSNISGINVYEFIFVAQMLSRLDQPF